MLVTGVSLVPDTCVAAPQLRCIPFMFTLSLSIHFTLSCFPAFCLCLFSLCPQLCSALSFRIFPPLPPSNKELVSSFFQLTSFTPFSFLCLHSFLSPLLPFHLLSSNNNNTVFVLSPHHQHTVVSPFCRFVFPRPLFFFPLSFLPS